MAFGLTPLGFVAKRQQDIISEIQASLQAAFGQNINLLPEAIFGQIVGIFSERETLIWQLAEAVYNSQYPSGAEGTSVDNILALNNLKRLGATASKTSSTINNIAGLVLFGTPTTVVPKGSLISVFGQPASQFSLDADVTIGSPVNAVQTVSFSSVPASGALNLSIEDPAGNTLTTGSIPWNAQTSVSKISFSSTPGSGFFTIRIYGQTTANILFSDNAAAVQTKIQALSGFSTATVSGSFASGFSINWGSTHFNPIMTFPTNTLAVSISSIDSIQAQIGAVNDSTVVVSTTANTTLGSNQLSSLGSLSGIVIGQSVTGSGIPGGTTVIGITGSVVNLSANATATAVGVPVTFTGIFPYTDVSVTGTFGTGLVFSFGGYSPTSGNPSSGNLAQNLMTVPVNSLLNGSSVAVNTQVVDTQDGLPAQGIGSATCTITGPTFAPAGTLNVIASPVTGWNSVNNPLDVTVGTNIETDTEALTRRASLLASQANGPIQAIIEKVQLVTGVTSVLGFENLSEASLQVITFSAVPITGSFQFLIATQDTGPIAFNATSASIQTQLRSLNGLSHVLVSGNFSVGFTLDFNGDLGGQAQPLISTIANTLGVTISYGFGRPGKSFEIVVNGGANSDIANAIYGAKPAGIQTYGNQNVGITDPFGNPYVINFSRPSVVLIFIAVTIEVSQVQFPLNGVQTIQQDLVTIGNEVPIGGLIVGFGTNGLVGAFNSVPGIVNYTLAFGTNNTPSSNTNIQLLPEQLAQFETFNISVTVNFI